MLLAEEPPESAKVQDVSDRLLNAKRRSINSDSSTRRRTGYNRWNHGNHICRVGAETLTLTFENEEQIIRMSFGPNIFLTDRNSSGSSPFLFLIKAAQKKKLDMKHEINDPTIRSA